MARWRKGITNYERRIKLFNYELRITPAGRWRNKLVKGDGWGELLENKWGIIWSREILCLSLHVDFYFFYMSFVREIIFQNNHGRFGDKVYRVINGRTFSSKYPVYVKGRKRSEKQVENNVIFGDAVNYAKRVNIDPTLRVKYERRRKALQNAWNLAIQDYMLRHLAKKYGPIDTSGWEELRRRGATLSDWEPERGIEMPVVIEETVSEEDGICRVAELVNPGG